MKFPKWPASLPRPKTPEGVRIPPKFDRVEILFAATNVANAAVADPTAQYPLFAEDNTIFLFGINNAAGRAFNFWDYTGGSSYIQNGYSRNTVCDLFVTFFAQVRQTFPGGHNFPFRAIKETRAGVPWLIIERDFPSVGPVYRERTGIHYPILASDSLPVWSNKWAIDQLVAVRGEVAGDLLPGSMGPAPALLPVGAEIVPGSPDDEDYVPGHTLAPG